MKTLRRLFATLFLLSIAGMATAQDVIVMKDQSTVMSKVLEITSTEIKYKKWNNQDGPTYSIDRSEVLSINYENGEVENFSETKNDQQNNNTPQVQYQYLNSYMTKSGGWLYLNGRSLSDSEILSLVGTEGYEKYQSGRKLGKTGIVLDAIGGTTLLVGLAMKLFDTDHYTLGSSTSKTYLAVSTIGGISLGTGILIGIFGDEKIEKVADTYNKNHGHAYSLNISPSLMQCEMPQSQGNCGLGLALSINF